MAIFRVALAYAWEADPVERQAASLGANQVELHLAASSAVRREELSSGAVLPAVLPAALRP